MLRRRFAAISVALFAAILCAIFVRHPDHLKFSDLKTVSLDSGNAVGLTSSLGNFSSKLNDTLNDVRMSSFGNFSKLKPCVTGAAHIQCPDELPCCSDGRCGFSKSICLCRTCQILMNETAKSESWISNSKKVWFFTFYSWDSSPYFTPHLEMFCCIVVQAFWSKSARNIWILSATSSKSIRNSGAISESPPWNVSWIES